VALDAFPCQGVIGFEKKHVDGNDEMMISDYKEQEGEDTDRLCRRQWNVAPKEEMTDRFPTLFDVMRLRKTAAGANQK
jgi:hypothetical protein